METSIPVWRRDEKVFVEETLASGEIKLRAVAILKMEDINADLAAAILFSFCKNPKTTVIAERFSSVEFLNILDPVQLYNR